MEYMQQTDVAQARRDATMHIEVLGTHIPLRWAQTQGVNVQILKEVGQVVIQFERNQDGRIIDRRLPGREWTQADMDQALAIAINKLRIHMGGGADPYPLGNAAARNPLPPMRPRAASSGAVAAPVSFRGVKSEAPLPPEIPNLHTTAGKLRKGMRFTTAGDSTEWEVFMPTPAGVIAVPHGDPNGLAKQKVFTPDTEVQVAR